MPTAQVAGIDLAPTRQGRDSPVILLTGLGAGRGWGAQVDLFAEHSDVVVPDHPGTADLGRSQAFTLSHHAEGMAGGGGKAACPTR
jgi:aminoacrylate hydrolase